MDTKENDAANANAASEQTTASNLGEPPGAPLPAHGAPGSAQPTDENCHLLDSRSTSTSTTVTVTVTGD
jgi:hypothetical protein